MERKKSNTNRREDHNEFGRIISLLSEDEHKRYISYEKGASCDGCKRYEHQDLDPVAYAYNNDTFDTCTNYC